MDNQQQLNPLQILLLPFQLPFQILAQLLQALPPPPGISAPGSRPSGTGPIASGPVPASSWEAQNEEKWSIHRDQDGFITSVTVTRDVHGR